MGQCEVTAGNGTRRCALAPGHSGVHLYAGVPRCGRVRPHSYINHPCVLEEGHAGRHEDRDGDNFGESMIRPVICDALRENSEYHNYPCVLEPGHAGEHQDSDEDTWKGAAPTSAVSRTERCHAMYSPEASQRYDCTRVKDHKGEHLDDAQNTAWPPSYGYHSIVVLDAPHPADRTPSAGTVTAALTGDPDPVLERIAVATEAILALLTPAQQSGDVRPECGAVYMADDQAPCIYRPGHTGEHGDYDGMQW